MPESAQPNQAFHAQLSSFFWLQINSAHLQQELVISIICFQGRGEDLGFFFPPFCLIQCLSLSEDDPCKNEDLQLVTLLFASHFIKNRCSPQNTRETCTKPGSTFRLLYLLAQLTKASQCSGVLRISPVLALPRLFLTLYVQSVF